MTQSFLRSGHPLIFFLVVQSIAFSSLTKTGNGFYNKYQRGKKSSPLTRVFSSSTDDTSSDSDQRLSNQKDDVNNANFIPQSNFNPREIEFGDLGSIEVSPKRKQRTQQEKENKRRFVKYGDDLWNSRQYMDKLSRNLLEAINNGERDRENEIRENLRQIEHQDPDLVYKVELENLQKSITEGRESDVIFHSEIASAARSCLPQFDLGGLWVGKYGNHGYEMINVTYQGDLLIAYKVTGDKNVPRGEITFQVDLNPLHQNIDITEHSSPSSITGNLRPISLTEKAAKKWGTTQLPRHKGLGQVAETGFKNNQWMDGQLIIIGEDYFSFAWVPIEHQIFFGRPSPELALKMLRVGGAAGISQMRSWDKPPCLDSDESVLKDYLTSCLDKTKENMEDENFDDGAHGDAFRCIWSGGQSEECYFQ